MSKVKMIKRLNSKERTIQQLYPYESTIKPSILKDIDAKQIGGGEDFLFIKKGRSFIKLEVGNIIYVQVEGRYSSIVSLKRKFLVCLSLKKLYDLLPKSIFYQTHRNFVVNVKRVNEICPEDNLIVLENNHQAILSERYKTSFINTFFVLK